MNGANMFFLGDYKETITPDEEWPGAFRYFARWQPLIGDPISGFCVLSPGAIAAYGLEIIVSQARKHMCGQCAGLRPPQLLQEKPTS